jgi:hypothetical protein
LNEYERESNISYDRQYNFHTHDLDPVRYNQRSPQGSYTNDKNHAPVNLEPIRYYTPHVTEEQPDYMTWSTVSVFLCFVWGFFAYRASNMTRKFNDMKQYEHAAKYSRAALKYNRSAVACCVLMFILLGVPFTIALVAQGSASKFPSARVFFG